MFLENYSAEIKSLCMNHKVKTLYALGSVLTEKFNKESDIDLVVDFDLSDPIEYAENYFALKFSLENLLHKQIDLLEEKAMSNPFLKKSIDSTKTPVYIYDGDTGLLSI